MHVHASCSSPAACAAATRRRDLAADGPAPIRASQRARQVEVARGRHLGAEATRVADADNRELTGP